MNRRPTIVVALTLLAAVLLSACTGVLATAPQAETVELEAISHLAMGLPEQDVFVEQEPGSDQVVRILQDELEAYKDAPVYAAAERIEHNLFQTGDTPLGPFEKGTALGMTMDEWLSATGKGSYTVSGDRAKISFTFENLVPHGVYTVWCTRTTFPPNDNVVDKVCGAPDGSENSFTADKAGRAHFELEMPAMPESSAETVSVLAMAYHSDGQTYGAYPGDFGLNSHVQIAAILPQTE